MTTLEPLCPGGWLPGKIILEEEMQMKRMRMRRLLGAVLALALMVSLVPGALAASSKCPECGSANCTWTTVAEATCHETGVDKCVCKACGKTSLVETPVNKNNHDAVYTDNGDGKTHTAKCPYDSYSNSREAHEFENGRCVKCLAVDYSSVTVSLPRRMEVYAAVGDEEAKLSVGDVTLTIGNVDITDDYTITYAWFYGGEMVGSGSSYTLPASVTKEEDDYTYTCVMMATAKSSSGGNSVNATCTVSVLVRELVSAHASVSTEDEDYVLEDTTSRNSVSVYDQIYDAVYAASSAYPDYVVFDEKPDSKVGELDCTAGREYSFDEDNSRYLGDLSFTPDEDHTGMYTINFTAYDTKGKEFPGVLTFTVERTLGEMDLLYTGVKGEPISFDEEDFSDFWLDNYDKGQLTCISFTSLPGTSTGVLYYGYSSPSRPGTRVKADDPFYYEAGSRQDEIDLTFVPAGKFTGYVTLPFEAYGENNRGKSVYLDGTVYLFISDGDVEEVSYRVTSGGAVQLEGDDFLSVYRDATDSKGSGFYIQLLELPDSGRLYVNYTDSKRSEVLKESNRTDYIFYYSNTRENEIDDLTYVAGTALTDSASYVAYDSKGELLYVGEIDFVRGDLTVTYTAASTGVNFRASDFRTLLGTASGEAITSVSFTPPTTGTLYYNYVNGRGTPVTAADKFYTSGTTLSVNNLTYVPRSGQSGQVSVDFTAYDLNNSKVTGTVKITVTATTPTPVVPVKTFPDVTSTQWYYTYVTDLATAGVINGFEDGTFRPAGEVTYAQALKTIMLAAGYAEPAKTGAHWASGYLTTALADGLLEKTVNLDSKISRNAIAEIAAKALKLPKSTLTRSPFTDSNNEYVLALYEAGIVTGNKLADGTYKYYGVNSIVRSEFAAIVWRINNYRAA